MFPPADAHYDYRHDCVGSRNKVGEVQAGADQVATSDRRSDIPEVTDDDDAARDPAPKVEDIVMLVSPHSSKTPPIRNSRPICIGL